MRRSILVLLMATLIVVVFTASSAFAQGRGGGPSEQPPPKSGICQKSNDNAFAGSRFAPDDQRGGPFGGSCTT